MTLLLFGILASTEIKPAPPRPAVMVRKNVRNLTATELQGLRDAVAAMKALPASDPCSWAFQANIHFSSCNHSSYYWLPWHRMYLYYFEKILVAKSGGKLKGLPYWDYAKSTQTGFPPSFYPSTYPSGGSTVSNPLYHSPRTNVTSASFALSFSSTDPTSANSNLTFSGFSGSIQSAPHNYVHGAIGGTMGGYNSPLDAVFWTHHCVIDRLWEKWLSLGGGRANPTFDSTWMNTSFTFYDYDAGCSSVTLKVQDVLDIQGQLNYKYEEPLIIKPPRYWWKWIEIIPPWPFPRVPYYKYGYMRVRLPIEIETRRLRELNVARSRVKTQTNVVLRFRVTEGESSLVPYDFSITPRGGKSVRLGTMAVFGVRHKMAQGHVHESLGTHELTLDPRASTLFLTAMRRGRAELSFAPLMRGVKRVANARPMTMALDSMSVMQAVKVDARGNRIP